MIKPNAELSITRQSALLKVSRSSVYYRPKPDSSDELDLLKRLDELFTENPMYGSRRMQAMLKREGVLVGRRRIRRLMRKLGLWAITPKPDTSRAHPEHKVYPYLLRGMTIDRPNQVWATDIIPAFAGAGSTSR
jgi:putative transposase